jgi:hypothetical protein
MNEIPRLLDALEVIASELEQLRVLKEHELGVRLEHDPDHGPWVPTGQPADETRSNKCSGPGYPDL